MLCAFGSFLAESGSSEDGDAFLGFLFIGGLVWFFIWLFTPKNKGVDIVSNTKIRPAK